MDNKSISIVVLTYNSDLLKILVTLESLLLQENIDREIIISDDGSVNFPVLEIETYFRERKFYQYTILSHKDNVGTVHNIYDALLHCNNMYVKLISPGDLICSKTALASWIDELQNQRFALSICDYYCYTVKNNNLEFKSLPVFPQTTKQNQLKYNCLIGNDLITGAAVLINKNIYLKYLAIALDKVKYCEDYVYRLMLQKDEEICIYNKPVVLYEHGSGISTGISEFWKKARNHDWEEINKLLYEYSGNSSFDSRMRFAMRQRNGNKRTGKIVLYIKTPSLICLKLKNKFFPRKSSQYYRDNFAYEVFENVQLYLNINQ